MAYFPDLAPCDYFISEDEPLLAVGWLERGYEYKRGRVSQDFFEKLKALCENPWEPIGLLGGHDCNLCQFEPPLWSVHNLWVPYRGAIYIAPETILHYIAQHWYKPPDIFIEAVIACPEMHSMAYKKAFLENGGRPFLKESKEIFSQAGDKPESYDSKLHGDDIINLD